MPWTKETWEGKGLYQVIGDSLSWKEARAGYQGTNWNRGYGGMLLMSLFPLACLAHFLIKSLSQGLRPNRDPSQHSWILLSSVCCNAYVLLFNLGKHFCHRIENEMILDLVVSMFKAGRSSELSGLLSNAALSINITVYSVSQPFLNHKLTQQVLSDRACFSNLFFLLSLSCNIEVFWEEKARWTNTIFCPPNVFSQQMLWGF